MSQAGIADKENSNMIKDPEDWVTGDEEMTGAQRSYLQTLCEEAGASSFFVKRCILWREANGGRVIGERLFGLPL